MDKVIKTTVMIAWLSMTFFIHAADTDFGKSTSGKVISLESQAGKVVMVSFWASWCSYCLKEIPILDKILNKVGDDRMAVIAINWKEDKKVFRKLARKNKHSKILFTHDPKGFIGLPYNIQAIPYLMIYDHTGRMRYKHRGYGEESLYKIVEEVNRLLLEQAASTSQNKSNQEG